MAKKKTTKAGKPATTKRNLPNDIPTEWKAAVARAQVAPIASDFWAGEKDGDAIFGTIMRLRQKTWSNGPSWELTLMPPGESALPVTINSATVISSLVTSMDLAVGDRIVICYRGLSKNTSKGRPARLYTIERL